MDSRRVLYFLGILNRETNGYDDEIASLFQRALDENDDIIRLKSLIEGNLFYWERGKSVCGEGEELLKSVYSHPEKSLDFIPRIKQMNDSIEREVEICSRLMHSPLPFSETITVLKKKDIIAYMSALESIVNAVVYLMVLYGGLSKVRALNWDDTAGIQERIYAVNTKFLPALFKIKRPNYSWVIRKNHLGGRALFGGDAFYLSYGSTRNVEMLCASINKEPLGTHAYMNVDAFENGEDGVPYCWGTGNILSVTPDKGLLYLSKSSVVHVRAPRPEEYRMKMPTPFKCLKQLSDGALYCLTPDDLVLAMNQWQTGHEIELRKRTHNCLFCGKYVDQNRLVCRSHFTTEL